MGVFTCTLLSGVGQGVTGVGLSQCQRAVTSILTTGLVCFLIANVVKRERFNSMEQAMIICLCHVRIRVSCVKSISQTKIYEILNVFVPLS